GDLHASRLRRLRRPARRRARAPHRSGRKSRPLRDARRRQPPPPRLPVLRADGRRGLRHRRGAVPAADAAPRLRDRRGRGHLLGPVHELPGNATRREQRM
ncbi:MAG: Transcriptional regulator, Fur family, partial [uncultured Solirubrobacteraceae bacterium]